MWKMTAGEFDISCIPCEHWWVRYAEFCQVLADARNILTEKINLEKSEFDKDGFVVCYKLGTKVKWDSKEYDKISKTLNMGSCPFIKNQKECQSYQPSKWYKIDGKWMSIKEIKKQKGYEV